MKLMIKVGDVHGGVFKWYFHIIMISHQNLSGYSHFLDRKKY